MNQPAPTALRDLRERETAARQRRDYHHRQFDQALARLKALGARCPGVSCPEVKAAGRVLSRTPGGEVHAPFMAFADALLTHARTPQGKNQGEGVTRLANRAMEQMRALSHHVDREVESQRELQLFRHCLEILEAGSDATAMPSRQGA